MAYVKVGEDILKHTGGDTTCKAVFVMDDENGKMWRVRFIGYTDEDRKQIGKWKRVSDGPNL